ncbi:MAG: hypothetical protein CVU30_05585 [Betaproteobacteria bacterium HGW-Betaproteobacteria-3]|nr:DUF2970 domain-containing protein [Burkholderiales bacterium]PKO43967.1 MAG: hypothetical protein CVU30_05585 [Betaproteobacteria bacterium HGW-Betaproteobacteria-3]
MKPPVQSPGPAAADGSFFRTLKAVAWSFVGIRKNSEYQKDLSSINPLHVIIVGIGAALALVVGLVVLVNVVVH